MKTKNVIQKLLVLLMLSFLFVANTMLAQTLPTDVISYETVTVTIPATSYDENAGGSGLGVPQMAKVKFNRQFPLVITSDDGRKPEYISNWALMNGYPNVRDWQDYPYLSGDDMLRVAYDKTYMGTRSSDVNDYQPLTFDDGTGHRRRFTLTSAVPPTGSSKTPSTASYDQINREDAKAMLRTGFSFAQHDVDDASSVETIKSDYTRLNTLWAENVGIGLKVMVEPNGNKNYVEASKQSDEICWNIYQAATQAYPALDNTLAQWTNGTQPSTYTTTKATTRTFPNSDAAGETAFANSVRTAISNGNTDPMFYGCHGLGSYAQNLLKDLATNATYKDKVWVTGADEFWEYYHIYNNIVIESDSYADGNLTFNVKVPTYKKNQFRELTINIPGLTGTGAPTFSGADGSKVITGSYSTDGGTGIGYTLNIGLESSITTHIDQLLTVYRDDQTNLFVKRDAQYLIDQLWDGTAKTNYQNQLDAVAKYNYTIGSTLDGATGPTIATILTDTNGEKTFSVPRYIVDGGKLYETSKQAAQPYYKHTVNTGSGTPASISYTEKSLSSMAGNITPVAVSVVEGEDMAGARVVGASFNNAEAIKIGSNGLGGNVVDGTPITAVSSLSRGKYKMIIGYGENYKSQGNYNYQILVGGTQVASFATNNATNNAVTEFTTEEFTVEVANTPITITTDNTNNNSRWIDYVVFVQTSSLDPVAPSITATASAGTAASVKVGTSITITATAAQNGGSNFTGTTIYQCSDAAGTIDGEAKATSATESATYTFTPDAAGAYYFKAVASDGTLGSNTTEVITLNVVANIDTYTLVIVDKSGGEAMTTTVGSASLTVDPLPNTLRSPYAENYKYYTTKAEAQANSGSYITVLAGFTQETIYVGYDVKSDGLKFDGSKAYAIYANSKYMHGVFQEGQAHVANNMWMLQRQSYDSWNSSNNNVTTTTFPFLDGSYLWYLQGSDPYNIRLQNKAARRYTSHENNSNAGYRAGFTTDAASSARYCLVYWNGSTSAADYCALWNRDYSKYVYMNSGSDGGSWRLDPSASKGEGKIYIADLPQLNINVLNPDTHEVEYTVDGRFMSGATLPSAIPFYLQRAFTSGQKFYYTKADAIAGTNAISGTPDASSMNSDGNLNVYLTYTLDANSWGTSGTIKPSVDENDAYWMSMTFPDGSRKLEAANSGNYEVNPSQTAVTKETPKLQWGFVGTPYSFRLINRANSGRVMGVDKSITTATNAVMYENPSTSIACDWEMVNYQNGGSSTNPLIRLRGSISGEAPLLFVLSQAYQKTLSTTEANNNRISSFTLIDEVHPAIPPTVTLTTTTAQTIETKTVVTLKATPVWNGTTDLTSLQFQYKVTGGADGDWENIGEAITSITSGTEYTKEFSPASSGTYSFRAVVTDADGTTGASASDDATPASGDTGLVTLSVVDDLPSTAAYSYKMKATLKDGDTEVDTQWLHNVESATELTNQHYFFPRYILNGTTLYETVTNPSVTGTPNPVTHCKFGIYRDVDGQNQRDNLTYNKVAGKDNVVFYGEAENIGLTGGNRIPNNNNEKQFDWGAYEGRFTYFASNGYGWRVNNADYGTITTLEPGKYTITIGLVGSTSADSEGAHVVKVGGTSVGAFAYPYGSGNGGLKEFTTSEFSIYSSQAVVITHNDNKNNGLDYVYIQRTGDANVTAPTVTLSVTDANSKAIETGGESLVSTAVTLKATATMNGGESLKNLTFQQKTGSGEWTTISTVATPTSGTEYTTTFTPSATGTVYFRALATTVIDSSTEMTGSSQSDTSDDATAFAVSVVTALTINEYTLHIIDNEGHDVFGDAITITKAEKDGLASGQDPLVTLRPQYASPFVSSYLYFNTAAEAQANSGTATTWDRADIYVGYTVDATKMGADKVHAIWANNNQYMHIIQHVGNSTNSQSSSHNAFVIQDQQYDVTSPQNTKQNSNVNCTTLPILDNSYMWQLGTDPYNFKLKNMELGMYCSSNSINSNPTVYDSSEGASATSYCVLYWQSKAGVTDATQPYYRIVLKSAGAATENILMAKNNSWQTNNNTDGNWDSKGKIYIKELPAVNINILNAENEVECTLQGYYKSDATMPGNSTDGYTPHNIERVYTSQHKWYYSYTSAEVNDPVAYGSFLSTTKLEASPNLYVKYTLDTSKWGTVVKNANTNYLKPFTDSSEEYDWYYILSTNNSAKPFQAASGTLPATVTHCTVSDITTNTATDDSKRGQWAFTGTPYNVKIINRYYGANAYVGIHKDDVTINPLKIYAAGTADVFTSFEALSRFGGSDNIFLRPTAVFNGNAPYLYLGHYNSGIGETHTAVIDNAGANSRLTFHWVDNSPLEHPSTVHLTASTTTPYVDAPVTLTATATPDNKDENTVTYLAIEQETSSNVWEAVGTAYEGSNVTNATKDAETGVVTVTYTFTPTGAATHNYRARAVIDNTDQFSTDAASAGGDGTPVTVTVNVRPIEVNSDNYTLILVDKAGNTLYTENNVSKDRVTAANEVSRINGDPLNNDWRSPLVTRYYYYKSAEGAKTNNSSDLFDWSSTATTPTVYVGYEVGTDIDLNTKVTDISERVRRSDDDATMVRNASKFGTMYMLKFLNGVDDYMENGKDAVETEQKKKPVYPYANGDGAMYIYDQSRWDAQAEAGASTRTRWPWYLVSPTNDPYHVYVTAWQQSHTDEDTKTNYYNFFRTYYNNTISKVVTTSISDDPKATNASLTGGDAANVPTQYMLLGTTGHYKLVTSDAVDGATADATYGGHQTVKTLENYWKNNPTVQTLAGGQDPAADNATLTGKGWHRYESWAYAANWGTDSKNKTYSYANHWYKTFEMGDGTFDLEPTEIDAVLVLLDNHGWEVMRQKIAKHKEADKYAAAQAALRKFDSPMVEQYKFYGSKSDDHKVRGYHKYNINNGANKALTESDRAGADDVFTSLADYPEKYAGGALMDLYVTYVVKPEYASTYQGAATEEGTSASQFVLRQGNNYAKANGTAIEGTTQENAGKWYLKPNFNIDTEMGYKYDVDKDGLKTGTILDAAATNTNYYNNGQQGFDPYNLRIQNVSTSTYLTTNATTADLTGSIWSGNGSTVSLTDATTSFTEKGLDETDVNISNATFMAVQDANGNMRLMPRFDYGKVVEGFTTLKEQAAAQPAGNTTHAQTTLLSTPVTYHIIDNSGADVFGALTANTAGFAVPKEYRSPMVEEYYYHSSLEDAKNNRTTASVTTVKPGDEVWVSYKAKDSFVNEAWNIYEVNGHYMHAVNRNDQGSQSAYWCLYSQNKDRDSNPATTTLTTATLPFLDNSFAWQFVSGNSSNEEITPDPYNVILKNKASQLYIHHGGANKYRMDEMTTTAAEATKYSILYFNNDATNDKSMLYNREDKTYVYYYSNNNDQEWRKHSTRTDTGKTYELVITQLPKLSINIVNADKEVECSLEGYYNTTASWTTQFVPFYLERIYTSEHTFYYDQNLTEAVGATVDYGKIAASGAVYVKYTLSSDWGVPTSDEDLNAKKAGGTSKVMPSPANNKMQWYAIKSKSQTRWMIAGEAKTDAQLSDINNNTNPTGATDSDSDKRGQWAFIGTPYNLKIVDRYHGMNDYLGVSVPTDQKAYTYAEKEGHVTTWEVVSGMAGNNGLQIRPQRSLNGETPYGYLGYDGSSTGLSTSINGNNTNLLYWLKETTAKKTTFKLYDKDGNYMADDANGGIADNSLTGYEAGNLLSEVFTHTEMPRRFCEYKFYSDSGFTTEVTAVNNDENETVYVKWDYTDDAPVFSQPGWDKRDYQYYMLGVWGFSNYNLMDVEGEGTTESPYTFKPNNTVGTPRDLKHQFAIVGNPYGFKLYNRAAGKDIKRNQALQITFADYETDGTTPTEEITFDLPIVSGSAYTSTETHFRSTKTGRYLSVTGTNENKLFSMTDNARGYTRFRYIIVPVRVFKEGAVSSTAEKDYRMYALEMNPSNTARTTDARITTNDLRATGNAIGNARDFNHAFCNYTYYQKYDWNTSVSAPVPDDGLSYYGGKDQNKRQFIATYTVDQEAFERLYYLDNSPHHNNAYSSKGAESKGSYTTAYNTQLEEVKADATDIYRWRFTGDPYDLQIHNVNTDKQSEDYVLAVKTLTADPNTAPTELAGTLALVTKDVKDGDSDTESYGQYSHWEIIKRSDNYYVLWNIDTNERYTYALTTRADKQAKNSLYVTVPPFVNGSTTVLNINQVEWNLVDVFNHYNVTWHVMEKTGETTYTEVARDTKVVDENVTLTIEDLPTSVKRHFCDYEKMYSDAACTTEITEHTVNAATDIYVSYTLDSGAPDFCAAEPTSSTAEKYWYELGYPGMGSFMYYDNATSKYNYNYISASDLRSQTTEQYAYYRWALVGTPYHVMLYNKATEDYLTTDGSTLSMSSTGTVFAMYDSKSRDLCALYDPLTKTYPTATAGVDTKIYGDGTAADFTNTYGLVKVTLILHYSDKTLRMYDSNGDHTLDAYCKDGRTEKIENKRYQKIEKEIDDIMPSEWRRPFCKYTYYWDSKNSDDVKPSTVVSTINQDMVTAHANGTTDIYVHVTYDFETNAPFKWSTNDDKTYKGKHWYYLVNNHRPNGELGKMVYRDSGPKLRVSTSLKENQLYLNNFEWCVIGDPYGFKMLNRYDPDRRFDEYIRVMDYHDNNNEGLQIEQNSNDSQNIFEMMPGQYSYNFWIHPVYTEDLLDEVYYNDTYHYVGNNYNGSAAIIPDTKKTLTYLHTNSSANFRLEILSDATLTEYVKYAGFVGSLKYEVANGTGVEVDGETDPVNVAAIKTKLLTGKASEEEKILLHNIINNPDNIEQMVQGYYRIVPYALEGKADHYYVQGYLNDSQRTSNAGGASSMLIETQNGAEYDPSTIFWFESTKEAETNYPRYYVHTQGLSMAGNGLVTTNAETDYKVRYEDLGAAITQLKVSNTASREYLSCASTSGTSTNQCFDEQAGVYKTRFYLQKVGEANNSEMGFKAKLMDMKDGYFYVSLYVPFDVDIDKGVAFIGKQEYANSKSGQDIEGTGWKEAPYKLRCYSVNDQTGKTQRYIPAGTPVLIRVATDEANVENNNSTYTNARYVKANVSTIQGENGEIINAPSAAVSSEFNKFRGQYLAQVLPLQNNEVVYVHGLSSKYGPGFFKNGNTYEGVKNNAYVKNNKLYYTSIVSSGAKSFGMAMFVDGIEDFSGSTTGIQSNSSDQDIDWENAEVYDLQGRRVRDPQRGIYIVNGKKVVIK